MLLLTVYFLVMTQTELVKMARQGKRIPRQPHSLHDNEKANNCGYNHNWRTIVCDNENDVCECSICGKQKVMICNFDDDFS